MSRHTFLHLDSLGLELRPESGYTEVPFGYKNAKYLYYCPLDRYFYQNLREMAVRHKLNLNTVRTRVTKGTKGYYRVPIADYSDLDLQQMPIVRSQFKLDKDDPFWKSVKDLPFRFI